MATARTVKDVSPHEFVVAYAAHLKRSGKVFLLSFSSCAYVYGVLSFCIGDFIKFVDFFDRLSVFCYVFGVLIAFVFETHLITDRAPGFVWIWGKLGKGNGGVIMDGWNVYWFFVLSCGQNFSHVRASHPVPFNEVLLQFSLSALNISPVSFSYSANALWVCYWKVASSIFRVEFVLKACTTIKARSHRICC